MATTEEILSGKNLTGLIVGTKSGLPIRVPTSFLTPNRTVSGKGGTYRKVDGTRQVARIVQYGSPSAVRSQLGVSEVPFVCIHSFEHQTFDAPTLINLNTLDNDAKQKLGRDEVLRQTTEFKQLFMNLRVAAVTFGLCQFHIYASAAGNLQTSAVGAMVDVDYGVPATNFNVAAAGVNPLGANIITAKWSAAATDIIGQIRALKSAAVKFSGYPLAHAFYGSAIPGYLAANTTASNYLTGNNELSRQYVETGEVPQGFMGLSWTPLDDCFFVDQAGTIQSMIAADEVVFSPAPSLDWYELIEGTYPVPMNFGSVTADATSMLQGMAEVPGMFSYAGGTLDPPSVKQWAGDTFLPVIKVPRAMFRFDTHW